MSNSKVTAGMAMSIDGFTSSFNQTFEKPFGDNFDSQSHDLFTRSDEIMARMFAIILESQKRLLI